MLDMMADSVGMAQTTDTTGRITRTVRHDGWQITQVQQGNGEWWNIRVERVGG